MPWEGLKLRLRNRYVRLTAGRRQQQILHKDFTIISNNCWGGLIYESYDLPKQSPTIGMYFMADEYIRFLTRLNYYLYDCKLEFIAPEKAKHRDFYAQDKRFPSFPVAKLGDVEIAMLHYHSPQEALEKWERRCQRINWDKLLVKMNDQNGCTPDHASAFGRLPYKNKIFFTVNHFDAGASTIELPCHKGNVIRASQEPFGASKYLNVNHLINDL